MRSARRFACFALSVLAVLGLLSPGAQARRWLGAVGPPVTIGFLPAGHWIASPTGQGLTPIFPLADSVTGPTARIHQAYWDGTNDIPYDIALGDAFGAYPYVCTLVLGPPGMTVEQSIYTTFQNSAYCRVLWHPQGNISSAWNGEVEIAVTDQAHATVDMSWALWTVGQYATSTFSGTATVNGSSTITVNSGTGMVPGMVLTGTCIPTGTYIAFDLGGTGSTGTYAMSTAATCSGGPQSITGAYGGGAVFVSTTGGGSTCTYAAPCTFTTAFGSTFAATSFPGAICYAFGGSYSNATGDPPSLPMYTAAQNDSGVAGFEAYAARKPNALIGLPGQTVTLDATGCDSTGCNVSSYPHLIQLGGHTPDWYMENITANGQNTNVADQYIVLGTSGRLTFDQTFWTNTGFGNGVSGNMSVFVTSGQQTLRQYLFITDSCERNRESGLPGNNIGFIDLYASQYALIQRDCEDSPGAQEDAAFYFKIDEQNSELRENYINANPSQGLGGFGAQFAGNGNNEVAYNLAVGLNEIQVGGSSGFTWQGLGIYRNTILSGSHAGLTTDQTAYNLEGPGGPGYVDVAGTNTTGGSLTAGDEYTWCVTSLGNSGESACVIGSYGSASGSHGLAAGNTNQNSYTLPGGDTAAIVSWLTEPGAIGYNGYRELTSCGGGPGCWTQYSLGDVTSWTDTGASGTAASPPSPSTAIVNSAKFLYYSNVFATTDATQPPRAAL